MSRDSLLTLLERHSQILRAAYELDLDGNARVRITWKNGSDKVFTVPGATEWLLSHPPRCWSWTDHVPKSSRETTRDYCVLTLGHETNHIGDYEVWE